MTREDPHAGQPVRTAGVALADARAAVVMLHGRGGTAEDILTLVPMLGADDVAYLAPQAAGGSWYPFGFMSPIERIEPGITSAMNTVGRLIAQIELGGVEPARTFLLGFSQGACLATEYVARHARRFGGVAGLSGGLIGPEGTSRDYAGSLDGTPVFLGTSDPDPHVPFERVRETEAVLSRMGAAVDLRRYPGMPHTINQEELDACRTLLQAMVAAR